MKETEKITGRVVVVLTNTVTGEKKVQVTNNIVTNAGDLYYAERGVNTAVPTNFTDGGGTFDGIMELYSGSSAAPDKANDRSDLATLAPSSGKAMDSTYPKLDDDDSDNTGAGAGVITYRVSYSTGEANATDIADVVITNPGPTSGEPLLMHAEFSGTFTKTSSDTLKVFVNHTMTGV